MSGENERLRKTRARKQPQQERSRHTVDAIIEATERVMIRDGFAKVTTNRVARIAGVSIGSLYQYFPNKESLVAAVVERQTTATREAFERVLGTLGDSSFEYSVRRIAEFYVERFREDRAFYQALLPNLGAVERDDRVRAGASTMAQLMRAGLERHRELLRPTDLDLAAFILVSAAEGIVGRAVLGREDLLDDGALVDELAELALRFLGVESSQDRRPDESGQHEIVTRAAS